ncbi:coatomer subunit delta-like [Oscarella lobularis]|uniref:coatomer subunit delta-like n=1 Tax=Oscarella lobularis TaxID=121494 RepID=UPI0033143A8F
MVLLAAAICTKNGKPLVSRQFVEMSRSRIEGLLAAFPKLIGTGKQHTFVETESVRYVYQPLEKMFMVLLTTKASNILEDLETLRLFSRVIPEYCSALDEAEVSKKAFELIFAFDEIIALGYRENVNLAQIRTFTEMDSHEEKLFKAVRQSQMEEAKSVMKKKAKELAQAKREAQKSGRSRTHAGGISSSDYGMSGHGHTYVESSSMRSDSSYRDTSMSSSSSSSSFSSRSSSSKPSMSKALKLGSKGKGVDSFVNQLKSEGTDITSVSSSSRPTRGSQAPPAPTMATESVHVRIQEKLSLEAGRDGGLKNLEVLGIMHLRVRDAPNSHIQLHVQNDDTRGFQLQPHPNVDKKLFQRESILGLKQAGKGFPLNNDVGIVKWRLQSVDEALMPLTINCWPSESGGNCEVNIEYELQVEDMELHDVTISVPVPTGVGAPVVESCDGEYKHESKKGLLNWTVPLIDVNNKSGTLEFSIAGRQDDFFPINVYFVSPKSFCDLHVDEVRHTEENKAVRFSSEMALLVDKYTIV